MIKSTLFSLLFRSFKNTNYIVLFFEALAIYIYHPAFTNNIVESEYQQECVDTHNKIQNQSKKIQDGRTC